MATRRVRLGLRQRDLAAAAGVSETTIRNIEAGRIGGRPTKWPLVEQALRWAPGSFEALREGRQPLEISGHDAPEDEEWTMRLPTRIREEITGYELFDSAVVDVSGGLRLIVLAVETEAPPHDRTARRLRIQRWEDVRSRLNSLSDH
ncbi:helix-turn-helix transcriptional regulator [Thermomonospora umbrina]|uniref:helix-turn-helix transcriptional regulator n=1 Tax=Thermomonospora umbrina TaxID=111806 RepID=UPI001476C595|nr:helix-turn-helix transcriptional regulator [Thermomonospora umbrina]